MPPIFGWYVAVASARTSVSVTIPCCEVPRGALDSRDGSVHCSGVMVGVGCKDVLVRSVSPKEGERFKLDEQDVVLAFDYTDEDFYGEVQGFWIHGWTGDNAVVGKFKFLTCATVSSNIPQKIPLISIPIHLGHNMAKEVCFCLSLVQPLVKSIKLILFDRGFYSKELMLTLSNSDYPYLIFVPKNDKVKKELEAMEVAERKKIRYEFKLNKNKTVLRGETTLAILKQIVDHSNEKVFDWAFATNQNEINLDYIVPTYKGWWRIETGFRVQDEARIKSKSKDVKIRFFYFVYVLTEK